MKKMIQMMLMILSLLIFWVNTTHATTNGLTISTAVEMAIANNNELQMAKEDVRIAEQNYREVRGQLFPQINLNASYKLTNNQLPKSAIPDFTLSGALDDPSANESMIAGMLDRMLPSSRDREEVSFAGQLSLSQPLFLGGKLMDGLRVLDKVKILQEKRYELEMQNTIITVVNAYYDLYLAEEGLSIQRQALSNAELHLQRVTNLFSQGLVSEYDKLRAELEVSRLHPEVLHYENLKNLAEENFKRMTGITEEFHLNPVIYENSTAFANFEVALDEAISSAGDKRLELFLVGISTEIYQVQYSAEQKNFMPNILLQADVTRYAQRTDSFNISGNDFGTMGSVGLVFQMPLFTGMSNTAKRIGAKHELRRAEYESMNTTELINLEVRQTWQSFDQSKRVLEVQEMNLNLAERALNIAQSRFENQAGIQLEVFDAQIQYNAAQIALAQARIGIIKDYFALNKALGNNLNNIIGEL
ncbi:MAG: TolC family protein [Candidatus Cloacimonetes bacterium]|nr:TolC family protein [Candidatus Cloacimonadota bacterium]